MAKNTFANIIAKVTWRNVLAKVRFIILWHKQIMLHVKLDKCEDILLYVKMSH